MTRINIGVHPQELPDKLLLAEHREITRIPNAIKSGRAIISDIPAHFTLGKGHVKYFYDKISYLDARYCSLYRECLSRGFKITDKRESFWHIPRDLYNGISIEEQLRGRELIIERINSKGFNLLPRPELFGRLYTRMNWPIPLIMEGDTLSTRIMNQQIEKHKKANVFERRTDTKSIEKIDE